MPTDNNSITFARTPGQVTPHAQLPDLLRLPQRPACMPEQPPCLSSGSTLWLYIVRRGPVDMMLQVLAIVYGANGVDGGLFFPNGTNGAITMAT